MKIVIIKYNAGNTRSVSFALNRLNLTPLVSEDPDEISAADKIIFPGVGEASSAMRYLKDKKLDQVICNLKQPVLGICLGMQLLCSGSEEGNTECLNIIPTMVRKFSGTEKVPHVGWNNCSTAEDSLFKGIPSPEFYFVHSFYAENSAFTIAECKYILPFSAALKKDNFYGTQFHPEKSGKTGEEILKNFLSL